MSIRQKESEKAAETAEPQTRDGMRFRSAETVPRLLGALNLDGSTAKDRYAHAAKLRAEEQAAHQDLDRLAVRRHELDEEIGRLSVGRQELDEEIARAETAWREKTAAAEEMEASAKACEDLAVDTRQIIATVAPEALDALNGQAAPAAAAVEER
jgi:cell division protein FtsB